MRLRIKHPTLKIGLSLLLSEILILLVIAVTAPSIAGRLLSMIGGNHIGGRLAFIAMGLENGFSPLTIIPIIIYYNTTYLLLMYSLFTLISSRVVKFPVLVRHFDSLKNKAVERKKLFPSWNRIGIAVFVWIPLPWTGAVIGAFLSHLEGYSTRETMETVLPSMWVGVITWTFWFDELFSFIEKFGRGKTVFLTAFLMVLPILMYSVERLRKIVARRDSRTKENEQNNSSHNG